MAASDALSSAWSDYRYSFYYFKILSHVRVREWSDYLFNYFKTLSHVRTGVGQAHKVLLYVSLQK